MSIWEYANPKKFMQTSGVLLPWVTALAVLALGVGLLQRQRRPAAAWKPAVTQPRLAAGDGGAGGDATGPIAKGGNGGAGGAAPLQNGLGQRHVLDAGA